MNYNDKLKDARWKQRRAEILTRDSFICQAPDCNNNDKNSVLNVHHVDYIYGIEPWEYPDDMLITLCSSCHEKEQERTKLERHLSTTLKLKGFLLSDLLALSCKIDTDNNFTESLLKILRQNG